MTTSPEPATASPSRRPAATWAWMIATFFGAGRLRPGPGTWGSLGALITWRLIAPFIPPFWQPSAAALYAAIALVIGVPAATRVARELGKEDPSFVVIDEVCGQMITLIGAPLGWKSLLAGFILFRAFDIVKPPPVRSFERLPEGIGIMMDDVAAGFYALICMRILLHFRII